MPSICKLCRQNEAIRRSHIFPEFMYSGHYDEKHRMLLLPTNPKKPIRTVHKGIYDQLLCKKCETKASVYEQYIKTLLHERAPQTIDKGSYLEVHNVDYTKIRIFQLSLIWKASVSSRPEFKHVDLGPHEDRIRQMILADDPGKSSLYPCLLALVINDGINPLGFTVPPLSGKASGHTCYSFIAGGLCWLYFISSHPVSPEVLKLAVSEEGLLPLYMKEATFFLGKIVEKLSSQSKL